MPTETEFHVLLEKYRRLRVVAQNVVDDAEAIGNPEQPRCGVPAHRVRALRRELRGEPAPSIMPFATMSPGS